MAPEYQLYRYFCSIYIYERMKNIRPVQFLFLLLFLCLLCYFSNTDTDTNTDNLLFYLFILLFHEIGMQALRIKIDTKK